MNYSLPLHHDLVRHAVVVTAAGSSRRFNDNSCGQSKNAVKKEFLSINAQCGSQSGAQSILEMAIRPFLAVSGLVCVVVTYRDGDLETVKNILANLRAEIKSGNFSCKCSDGFCDIYFVKGGETRQESVFNALSFLYENQEKFAIDYVSIHDGARPFVDSALIQACLDKAVSVGGACPGVGVTDTLVKVDEDGILCGRLDRSGAFGVQTPQTFRFPDIYRAHCRAAGYESGSECEQSRGCEGKRQGAKVYTDDSEIFMDFGGKVGIVPGSSRNRKITFAKDIENEAEPKDSIGGVGVERGGAMRVGTGWDIHALVAGRDLVLGGVRVESERGCLGHSDGDALIHAVIDGLLGACGMADIGTLFPDTDPRYEGISSSVLLTNVVERVKMAGWRIVNVDTTVILQSPKLLPYKDLIRRNMAKLLDVDETCFSVKAKTAERMLAELGRAEAVECQAVCLVERV